MRGLDSRVTNEEIERRSKRVEVYGCFGTKDEAYDVGESSRAGVRLRTEREREFERRTTYALYDNVGSKRATASARVAREFESEVTRSTRIVL